MFPFFRLGPFLVQLPALALLVGVWLGSSLAEKAAARSKLDMAAVNGSNGRTVRNSRIDCSFIVSIPCVVMTLGAAFVLGRWKSQALMPKRSVESSQWLG